MSGKASVRAGAPRLLVYVADRPPGPAAAPPPPTPPPHRPYHDNSHRSTVYRQHADHTERHPNQIYYKTNDNDGKVTTYETDNVQREFFSLPPMFMKEACVKVDENKTEQPSLKRDCTNSLGTEFGGSDPYRIPEPVDVGYQTRCTPAHNIMPMQPMTIKQSQNQFDSSSVQSEVSNDGELSVGKSYVNYQFLEQNVSHQSIVNQSISILNQQVGVNRGVSDGEGPQLVRTAEGVVLAVLPATAVPQPELQDHSRTSSEQTIVVPLGWKRVVSGAAVLYVSPSGTALSNLPQLREYLQTAGTCKCGLPCPLRPETAFSFDPKVISKPYQPASGAELTKLCNHKRKLLATLAAQAQSPATPPPAMDHKKALESDATVLKKKTKKRAGFPNMSISQLIMQRERPLNDIKVQDSEHIRTMSPGIGMRNNQCLPMFQQVQHLQNAVNQEGDVEQKMNVQRGPHYLTVNSGWITQQENIEAMQKAGQQPIGHTAVGMPVLGTNGQIIGVNTGFKQSNYKNKINVIDQNLVEPETSEKRRDSTPQNVQQSNQPTKEEESHIFCGLNQPLTPEVMQKINEQQHIFIQQNQKQIEMAMKGFKPQLADNQNKHQGQSQYIPQAQLVIQNGAVVKTNPAKTPPWQVKRTDSNSRAMTSPSPKPQKLDSDHDEVNANISEDSSGSYSSFPSNEQPMCSRVPPLPQHYNIMGHQWPAVDVNKKKAKGNKGRKKNNVNENKVMTFGGNGMRFLQDPKGNLCDDIPNNNVPSFMDDPSGYLAQQTVFMNNTISRQVGINPSFDGNSFEQNNTYASQNQNDKSCKIVNKTYEVPNIYKNNMVPNPSPSPNNIPDSSVLSEKGIENSVTQCCKGCVSIKPNPDASDNQMRLKYMKPNVYKLELDGTSVNSSPRHGFEDNPVTSSTFIDRSPVNDSYGPIQAGTVSTSNASPPDTLQQPEPSPTLSNSSRSTDTPHSSGSNNSQIPHCTFPMPSPAYSNPGSCRDHFNNNPSTHGCSQSFPYNSPGPTNNQHITGTQMMHFISNHNVNKNLMEVDNISMVGVKPVLKLPPEVYRSEGRKRMENTMPGYCPPPHLGGGPAQSLAQACYIQTYVTTMASGFSVTRDTVTSVLAGKANTATTSINASQANFIRPPPPPSVNLATSYAIPNNQPDPFLNSVNLPTSYPLHIAGSTAQNMISKSPLEIAQNVIGSIPPKSEQNSTISISARKPGTVTPGQILISSTGQIIVSNNQMPPPPPKTTTVVSPNQGSGATTNVTTSVTQVVPQVGQPLVNQSTVVVNTMPAPFVIQPPMMAVDGQVVQQNTVLPQIVTGVVSGQSSNENTRQVELKNGQGFVQGVAMLSPESLKKRTKKKKGQANITNVLQIAAPQQNSSNVMVHSSPQHITSPQFSPRGFQLSPNNNISPTPMLQALTIVPGKSGTPAHIVMNGQGSSNSFGSQQIITNTSPSQQINLLQPVNLINNASGVVPNFPAFQQFIVPNLGGMVMTADGTAIIQDNSSGVPMQLQLQTVNGQNVLTPVQGTGVFTGANGGVVIRAQNQQGKIIQSQHSPGAQFLSPNSQVMMNSPNFNGQLSPLLANLSPTNVTFNTSPHQVRSSNVQAQEFIQTNQLGQSLMVPLSPKQVSLASATNNRSNSTFVQQNTTIFQQQTTLVSNSQNTSNMQGGNRLSIDPNILLAKNMAQKRLEMPDNREKDEKPSNQILNEDARDDYAKFMSDFGGLSQQNQNMSNHVRHSVSTQTLVNQRKSPSQAVSGSSPPDTTTHSPLGAMEPAASPRVYNARCVSTQGNYADTTTKSPEPADINSSGMVQCVSSSEPDADREWRPALGHHEYSEPHDAHNIMSNIPPMMRQNRTPNPMESEMHYNQAMSAPAHPHMIPPNFYDRPHSFKRKNDFGDGSSYRTDKIMRSNNGMVHMSKDNDFKLAMTGQDKQRHFASSGPSSEGSTIQKVFERRNLGSGDDTSEDLDDKQDAYTFSETDQEATPDGLKFSAKDPSSSSNKHSPAESQSQKLDLTPPQSSHKFSVGDLVWGPLRGFASWPGCLLAKEGRRWRVRWFGPDKAVSCVDGARLLTLTEGLEAHHAARTKHRKSRKLNTLLENAIQEAMAELDKKSEVQPEATSSEIPGDAPITDTPRKGKKLDKNKEKHHKRSLKVGRSDNARLRSAR